MSHSNVGGVKTKITTTTKTTTSSSSFSTQKQHLQHRQHEIQQKVISKPPHKKENDKENHISVVNEEMRFESHTHIFNYFQY